MLGDDMDQAVKKLHLKGDLMRMNPALKMFGLGLDKGTIKQLSREMPELGALTGGLAGPMGKLGLMLLPLHLFSGWLEHMLDLAKHADPEAAKAYSAAWDNVHDAIGKRFVGVLVDLANVTNRAAGALEKFGQMQEEHMGDQGDWTRYLHTDTLINLLLYGEADPIKAKEAARDEMEAIKGRSSNAKLGTLDSFSDALTEAAFSVSDKSDPIKDTAENTKRMAEMLEDLARNWERPDVERALQRS